MGNLKPLNFEERARIEKIKRLQQTAPFIFFITLCLGVAVACSYLFNNLVFINQFTVAGITSFATFVAIHLFVPAGYHKTYDFTPLELEQLRQIESLKQESKDVEKYLKKLSRLGFPLTQYDFKNIEKIAKIIEKDIKKINKK